MSFHEPRMKVLGQLIATLAICSSGVPTAFASDPGEGSLRFVMSIGLMPQAGDTVNPTCYSKPITLPGPPGWGARGFLPEGSGERARQSIESYKARFIAACRATGRETEREGNFSYQWNRFKGDEEKLEAMRPRYPEDVQVDL